MDDLSLLDDLIEDGDEIIIRREDSSVFVRKNGTILAIEESLRAAIREAYSKGVVE